MLNLPPSSVHLPNLGRLIADRGFRRAVIAKRMGYIDPSLITLWASGQRLVPSSRLPALADALQMTVEDLLRANGIGAAFDLPALAVPPPSADELPTDEPLAEQPPAEQPVEEAPLPQPAAVEPAHDHLPEGSFRRMNARSVLISFDGTPMGPGGASYCTCGRRVR